MKKFIIAIMCVLGIATVYAENSEITTSQYYVDTKLSEKQDAAPANNINSVMTYDSASSDGVGTKAIYNASSTYEPQKAALVTAGTANGAIQNGINNEFTCANPPKCNLWRMTGLFPPTLPTGYTELEYVTFNYGSYIDTGVVLADPTNLEHVFNIKVTPTRAYHALAGFVPSSNADDYPRYSLYSYYNGKWMGGINVVGISDTDVDSNTHTIKFVTTDSNQTLYDTDNTVLFTRDILKDNGFSTNTLSLYLGARNFTSTGSAQDFFIGDIGRSYLKQNGVMLYNYIPCRRDSDNVVGFYDTVSQTFKTKSGSGTFTAGPVASYIPQNH